MSIETPVTRERQPPARIDAAALFSTLRDRICLLDYPPGTVLREAVLAAEFGLSRTPIRSVLQRLAHDGLIESRDGVGTIVTAPDFPEIRDIYLVRLKIAERIGQMDPRPIGADPPTRPATWRRLSSSRLRRRPCWRRTIATARIHPPALPCVVRPERSALIPCVAALNASDLLGLCWRPE